jgi:hypothetical protein
MVPALLYTPLDQYLRNSIVNTYAQGTSHDPALVFQIGFVASTLSFWVNNQWRNHLVGGPLVDTVSGVMLVIGFFIALFRLDRRVERLALTWFLLGIVLVCLTDFSEQAYLTRLQVMMPGAALLVGLGVWAVAGTLGRALQTRGSGKVTLARVAALALVVAIPPLNLYQLLVDSPTHLTQTAYVLMLKSMRERPGTAMVHVGASSTPDHTMSDIFLNLYPELKSRYSYVGIDQLANPSKTKGSKLPSFMVSSDEGQILEPATRKLHDGYNMSVIRDPIQLGTLWLFEPQSQP